MTDAAATIEALRAALGFYARVENWHVVVVPAHLVPPDERVVMLTDEGEVELDMMESGPAIDTGAHARFVLDLLERGEI